MAKSLLPPYANNATVGHQLFEQRLLYREKSFSRLFDLTPLDILYEKPFYGKVDVYGTPIYPSEVNMAQLPGEGLLLALDFVVTAFQDFKNFIDNQMAASNGGIFTDLFSSFMPKSALINVHQAYNDHFIKRVFEIFANNYINVPKINRKIRNFNDLATEFLNYAHLMSDEFPVTKAGFIVSPFCPNAISGLIIELEDLPYDDDLLKYDRFFSRPSFNRYLRVAANFGFYVDKNVPWRIVANMDSPPMTGKWPPNWPSCNPDPTSENPCPAGYMERFGVALEGNSVFSTYFYESEYFSYESIKARLWNIYTSLTADPKTNTYGAVYEVKNCMNAPWASIGSSRYKTTLTEGLREKVSIYFDEGDIPIDLPANEPIPRTFKQQYDDEYFLEFYFKLRLAESNIKYGSRGLKAVLKKASNFHKTFGIEAAVAYVGHIAKQTKIYKEIPTDEAPPFKINYFGDSTSSGLYSYKIPAIIKKEKVPTTESTEY